MRAAHSSLLQSHTGLIALNSQARPARALRSAWNSARPFRKVLPGLAKYIAGKSRLANTSARCGNASGAVGGLRNAAVPAGCGSSREFPRFQRHRELSVAESQVPKEIFQSCLQPWGQHRKDMELLERVQRRHQDGQRMEQLCWEERL